MKAAPAAIAALGLRAVRDHEEPSARAVTRTLERRQSLDNSHSRAWVSHKNKGIYLFDLTFFV
jgi:hypothetical protein